MKQNLLVGLLIASITLNAIFISWKVYNTFQNKSKAQLTAKTSADLFKEIYKYSPAIDQEIVFLGNSITAAFQIEEYLPGYNIRNRGISGNTTKDILNRIDDIVQQKPGKVFIMMGINDIVEKVPTNKLVANYSAILEKIKNQSAETKIYIQSILPVTKNASNYFSGDELKINQMINEVNGYLIQLAEESGFIYINLHTIFISNGELNHDYSWDGIHINTRGYDCWAKHIQPFIVNTEQQ